MATDADREQLRADVLALMERRPDVIDGAGGVDRAGRVVVHLAAWGESLAAELREQYGDRVELMVGCFRYPSLTPWPTGAPEPEDPLRGAVPLPKGLAVTVDVPGGVLHTGPNDHVTATVRNTGERSVVLTTGGGLHGYLTLPGKRTGIATAAVSVFAIAILTTLEPGATHTFNVLTGVASLDPRLGYCVPPGPYDLVVTVPLPGRRGTATARPVPVTVVGP